MVGSEWALQDSQSPLRRRNPNPATTSVILMSALLLRFLPTSKSYLDICNLSRQEELAMSLAEQECKLLRAPADGTRIPELFVHPHKTMSLRRLKVELGHLRLLFAHSCPISLRLQRSYFKSRSYIRSSLQRAKIRSDLQNKIKS